MSTKKPYALGGWTSLISLLRYCLLYLVKVRSPPHSGHGFGRGRCVCSLMCFPLLLLWVDLVWLRCIQHCIAAMSTNTRCHFTISSALMVTFVCTVYIFRLLFCDFRLHSISADESHKRRVLLTNLRIRKL